MVTTIAFTLASLSSSSGDRYEFDVLSAQEVQKVVLLLNTNRLEYILLLLPGNADCYESRCKQNYKA